MSPKPVRKAELGTVGAVKDDLRLLRSRGGIAAARFEDVAGTCALIRTAKQGEDDLLADSQTLLRNTTLLVCERVSNNSDGQGLNLGAKSLQEIMLADVPVTSRVGNIRTRVAEGSFHSIEYILDYEEQVIELIAREVFAKLRKSEVAHARGSGAFAHLPHYDLRSTYSNRDSLPVIIREAISTDHDFVVELMDQALDPYYGGDHRAHAERIFSTHIEGGIDKIGHFSIEQRMFIAQIGDVRAGLIHVVGKRQLNYKISPLIVSPEYRGHSGVGRVLLEYAEIYAQEHLARQIYCTVAEQNIDALNFFKRHGYIVTGRSESHYKQGITELMLFKPIRITRTDGRDLPNISVVPCEEIHEPQVRKLLIDSLSGDFLGIDDRWVDALFDGYRRRLSRDINLKFKLLFVAVDRQEQVLGVAGATPKKGQPIKIMPLCAKNEPAFLALLTDVPYQLSAYGRKIYAHLSPSPMMVQSLQERGWTPRGIMSRCPPRASRRII
jgi:ribosomal protein S18 acetylase RimI-like enzyme